MKHLDLFSGIGGFAYAIDQVWDNVEHIFCDNNKFCQQVLKKHWPNSKIYDDIRTIANTEYTRGIKTKIIKENSETQQEGKTREKISFDESSRRNSLWSKKAGWKPVNILTGGFPCQPFSQAGKRKGTDDDRYLWPEMLRVIQATKPQWVVAENVRGLLTQQGGMVFEQVCLDLEGEGYDVQPLIVPAVSKNAPHRRDRIWFIANKQGERQLCKGQSKNDETKNRTKSGCRLNNKNINAENSVSVGGGGRMEGGRQILERKISKTEDERPSWEKNWIEVATELCGVDDGLPAELDGFKLTKAGHRTERLKALGNAIVPQVAIEIFKGIKYEI